MFKNKKYLMSGFLLSFSLAFSNITQAQQIVREIYKDRVNSPFEKNVADPLREVAFEEYLKCFNSLKLTSKLDSFYNVKGITIRNARPTPSPTALPEIDLELYSLNNNSEDIYAETQTINPNLDMFLIPERVGYEMGYTFITDSNTYFLPLAQMGNPKAFNAFGEFGTLKKESYPVNIKIVESKNILEFLFSHEKIWFDIHFNNKTKGVPSRGSDGWTWMNTFKFKNGIYDRLMFEAIVEEAVVPQIVLNKSDKNLAYLLLISRLIEAAETIEENFRSEFAMLDKKPNPVEMAHRYFNELDSCESLGIDQKIPVDVRRDFLFNLHRGRFKVYQVLNSL